MLRHGQDQLFYVANLSQFFSIAENTLVTLSHYVNSADGYCFFHKLCSKNSYDTLFLNDKRTLQQVTQKAAPRAALGAPVRLSSLSQGPRDRKIRWTFSQEIWQAQ
jgi:hypothetical protein